MNAKPDFVADSDGLISVVGFEGSAPSDSGAETAPPLV